VRSLRLLGLTVAVLLASAPARAGETLVAVAANFAGTAEALAAELAGQSGHRVTFTSASTGQLYAQIRAGAPFAALLAADAHTPERLEAEGLGVPGTRFVYAVGRLALWSADAERVGPDGAAALRDASLRHLAIANPELAPYGVAAREVLQELALWDALAPRIVMGQNVGQAQSLVASGAAELGFVALAQVRGLAPGARGSRWEVPASLHAPIEQEALLLAPGRDDAAARAFLELLRSPAARERIARAGYAVPGAQE
jgi:molybdate transport system substrate-binding protein